ncbi:DUF2007 domain-containing protein [bacterium]|nr:DUF2007 domain-containing protein [bacterium]
MENWKTILTFTYPHEAHLTKTKLESEGFEVLITDELTAQVNNFYSNAIGGVKLQIKESDYKKAYDYLIENRLLAETKETENKLLAKLDSITAKLPWIGNSILELRLLVSVAILSVMLITPIVLLALPSKSERLIEKSWCIDSFSYMGKYYQPNTTELKIVFNNGCTETFYFEKYGDVKLPGFNSGSVDAKWKIENGSLIIYNSDTLSHIYNGKYRIEFTHVSLRLESKTTIITGFSNRINLDF